jgi:hypothetical protein
MASCIEQDIDYHFAARFVKIYEKICNYQEIDIDYTFLSGNPRITMAYVSKHPEKPWNPQALTSNPSISIAYMDQHPEYPWQPDEYHLRKYGGEEEIVECEDLIADEDAILPNEWHCKNVSLAMIEKNMFMIDMLTLNGYDEVEEVDLGSLVWHHLTDNPNLTLEFLEKYYQKPWNCFILANNPLNAAKAQFRKQYLAS